MDETMDAREDEALPPWAALPEDLLEPSALRDPATPWTFPSDHLPAALDCELDDRGYRVVTWNVMNSMWVPEHDLAAFGATAGAADEGLDPRQLLILQHVGRLFEQGADVVCLQECGRALTLALQVATAEAGDLSTVAMISSWRTVRSDQEVTLFDPAKLLPGKAARCVATAVYPSAATTHTILDVSFRAPPSRQLELRVVNTHVPRHAANELGPAPREDLLAYLRNNAAPHELAMVVAGDFNATSRELAAWLQEEMPDELYVPHGGYRTCVSFRRLTGRDLDTFLVRPPGDGEFRAERVVQPAAVLRDCAAAAGRLG